MSTGTRFVSHHSTYSERSRITRRNMEPTMTFDRTSLRRLRRADAAVAHAAFSVRPGWLVVAVLALATLSSFATAQTVHVGSKSTGRGQVKPIALGDVLEGQQPTPSGPKVDSDLVISPTSKDTGIVYGVVSVPDSMVRVQGGLATVEVFATNGDFAAEVPLHLNQVNTLYVTELFSDGSASSVVSVEIVQDGQAPKLFIDFPPDGAELTSTKTDVAGRVSDLLSGFMGLEVKVNGIDADVDIGIGTNGTFLAQGVPLDASGETLITAYAVDAVGNVRSTEIAVAATSIPEGAPFMEPIGGNDQVGVIGEVLPSPLMVKVFRGDGSPFAGKTVTFEVTRSDGLLSHASSPETPLMQVTTDNNGIASVDWRLGSDAGCGNNRVGVVSQDIAGTVFFCASALPGPAAQINVGSGNNQVTAAGSVALAPLRVWVSDSCNGVEGIPVTFTVVQGGGMFQGPTAVTVMTGPTGHAEVGFVLGATPGTNRVEADFEGNLGVPATFVLVGLEQDEQATAFSGVVLDNGNQPIEGALCSLEIGGAVVDSQPSGADGRFRFEDTLIGPALLHVDGSQATHVGGAAGMSVPPGSFPSLSFDVVLVENAENALPGPVLLPPLDAANTRIYDGKEDVVLTVEGVAGLEMIVKAGSMTRADGTMPSVADPQAISLNQVHHDKVPMPMPDGAAPPFAWTLQPAGATFDPPVEIRYPNMSGLPPGAISYFLSFNHDTDNFEIIGSGRVSKDGSHIVSDPGVGIATAGWGCNCPPYSITEDCENCNVEVTGDEFACGVPTSYEAEVTGNGTLQWVVEDGGNSFVLDAVSVSDGQTVSIDYMFQTPAAAGELASSGNKIEAVLTCDDGPTDTHGVGVTTVLVEWDPNKVNLRNVSTANQDNVSKCLPVLYSSSDYDLANLLTPESDVENVEFIIEETNVLGIDTTPEGSTIPLGGLFGAPGTNTINRFKILARHKECEDSTDRLWLVVHSSGKQSDFTSWTTSSQYGNSGTSNWLTTLQAGFVSVYSHLDGATGDPEPSDGCDEKWKSPGSPAPNYHPGAAREMRSEPVIWSLIFAAHGHQAMYNSSGSLITSGVGAGTADYASPDLVFGNPFVHLDADVEPFFWASQLDGNPVIPSLSAASLDKPLMYQGEDLGTYLSLRPELTGSQQTENECIVNN